MNVVLKKTNITKSIMEQVVTANYSYYYNVNDYERLGWCIYKNRKYILLYSPTKDIQLLKLPFIGLNDIELVREGCQEPAADGGWIFPYRHKIKITFSTNKVTVLTETDTEGELYVKKCFENLKTIITEVSYKGQFYL